MSTPAAYRRYALSLTGASPRVTGSAKSPKKKVHSQSGLPTSAELVPPLPWNGRVPPRTLWRPGAYTRTQFKRHNAGLIGSWVRSMAAAFGGQRASRIAARDSCGYNAVAGQPHDDSPELKSSRRLRFSGCAQNAGVDRAKAPTYVANPTIGA